MEHEYRAKEESLKTKRLFASFSNYKLGAGEHFVHYVFGLGSEGYRVGGVEEVLDQVLMVLRVFSGWETIDMKFHPMSRTHEQAGRVCSMELEIRLASA